MNRLLRHNFYLVKPLLPRGLQIRMRRRIARRKRSLNSRTWPIDRHSSVPPKNWSGWPQNKQFALVLTHDVESSKGHDRCLQLKNLEKNLGFRSGFYFTPERYPVSEEVRHILTDSGFEVGVHGLNHDGKLFRSKKIFERRVKRINYYLNAWNAVGFRSPAMHCNLDWMKNLHLGYDLSTFDTDPFEPQPEGVGTIFPFWVNGGSGSHKFVEMPYTLPQDFTLYVLLQEPGITIWKEKLHWIAANGGMALMNTHPDYMNFSGRYPGAEEYPVEFYLEFLHYVKETYQGKYWHALPREVALFWSSAMDGHENFLSHRPRQIA